MSVKFISTIIFNEHSGLRGREVSESSAEQAHQFIFEIIIC